MTKRAKITLIVVILLVIAVAVAVYLFIKAGNDLSQVHPDYTFSSSELVSAYSANVQKCDSLYLNKVIEVRGILSEVIKNEDGTSTLVLRNGDELVGVNCHFSHMVNTTQLKNGAPIVVRGTCSGLLINVILNNCLIVSQ